MLEVTRRPLLCIPGNESFFWMARRKLAKIKWQNTNEWLQLMRLSQSFHTANQPTETSETALLTVPQQPPLPLHCKWWQLMIQVWTDIFSRRFTNISRRRDSEKFEGRKIDRGRVHSDRKKAKCHFYLASNKLKYTFFLSQSSGGQKLVESKHMLQMYCLFLDVDHTQGLNVPRNMKEERVRVLLPRGRERHGTGLA